MDPDWVDVFPIKNGGIFQAASYVSLPAGISSFKHGDTFGTTFGYQYFRF